LPYIIHNTFINADVLAGMLLLVMGIIVRNFPPRKVDTFWGYHSFLATRNQDTWDTANCYAARLSILLSCVLIALGLIAGVAFTVPGEGYYYFTGGTAVLAVLMLPGFTERYLYRHFSRDGTRKPED
jgi:hypothetical protein